MPCCRPAFCAAYCRVLVMGLLTVLGLASLAADGSAQPSPADSAARDPNVLYAEIWTPRSQTGTFHLHGGVFAPINASATGATLGTRIGFNMGSHLLLGLMGDWTFKSKSLSQPVESGLPGFEPEIVLARVDAHLIPAMLFLQVKLTDKFPLVPYAGVGAGYEWLILQAHDYRTGDIARSVYGNVAWQSYAGLGMRLSSKLRLDGELFYNGGSLERDVTDQDGVSWTETVDAEGVGVRVGLDIVY